MRLKPANSAQSTYGLQKNHITKEAIQESSAESFPARLGRSISDKYGAILVSKTGSVGVSYWAAETLSKSSHRAVLDSFQTIYREISYLA